MRSESYARVCFLVAAVLSSVATRDAHAQDADWRSFGPPGGTVLTIAVDPQDGSTVYAGARGGAFKSTAGGAAWRNVSEGLGKSAVSRLVIDPTDPSKLYASTLTPPRFYRSRDAGETWEVLDVGLFPRSPRAVVVDPTDGARVWALLDQIYRSLDGGTTWESSPVPTHEPVSALAVAVAAPDRLYSAYYYLGVYRSTDGGETWEPAGLRDNRVENLIVDPDDADVVFADVSDCGGRACIYRSFDAGRSWQVVQSRPFAAGGEFFVQLLEDPRGTGALYLLTNERILKSTDRGTRWTTFVEVPPELPSQLAMTGDGTAYLATSCGVFRSAQGGAWQAASGRLIATDARAVAVDPSNPGILLAGTLRCGRFRSVDGGVRWLRLPGPRTSRHTQDLAIDPSSPATRWYAATRGGLFRTTDGGASWQSSRLDTVDLSPLFVDDNQVAVAASDPRVVYAVRDSQLFRSVDRGASFSRIDFDDLPRSSYRLVATVAIDPTDASTVYVAQPNRVAKSTDGGRTWRQAGDGVYNTRSLAIDPAAPRTLYAVARSLPSQGPFKVQKSEDGGETWREADPGLPRVTAVEVDPGPTAAVYAGSSTAGVWVSFDGAETWQPLADTEPVTFVSSLAASTTAVYAGTFRGVVELPRSCGDELAPAGEPATVGAGTSPDVAVDGAGRSLVVWTAPDGSALARALDTEGRPLAAPFQLDSEAGRSPAAAADGPGEVLAVWSRGSGLGSELRARVFGVGGVPRGGSRRIDREPRRAKLAPAVARTRTGESVVVWESVLDPQSTLIRGQRLDDRGVAVGEPLTVRGDVDRAFAPAVSADAFGRFTVAWLEMQALELSVRARSYQPSGAPRSDVLRLSGEEASVVEAMPVVAVAPTGEVVAGWLERTPGGNQELALRWLGPSGSLAGEQRLDAGAAGDGHAGFDVDIDRFGNTLAVWRAGADGIRARIFDAAGLLKSEEVAVGTGGSPAAAYDLAGRAVVVWEDGGSVVARRLRLSCHLPDGQP